MTATGKMLVFKRKHETLIEYLNSLYKESPAGEPTEPVVRSIMTVNRAGRKVAILKLGQYFRRDSKVIKLIIDALVKLNMPIRIESENRELSSDDFLRHLRSNEKVLVINTIKGDQGPPIVKYTSKDFKRDKAEKVNGTTFPDVVHWLETMAICPEVIIFDVRSGPLKNTDHEDIAYTILREVVE
jgi:hypothetical protein